MDPPITSIAIANAYTPTRLSTYSSTPACTAVPALMGTVPNVSRLPRSPNTMPPVVGPGAGAGGRPWVASGPGSESDHGEGEWDRVGAALQAGAAELVVCA